MPKRELSPDSQDRNQRPFQQQKSISDVIGPMINQCHLDLANNQSLASLANNSANRVSEAASGSTGSSRQNSTEEGNQDYDKTTCADAGDLLEDDFTDADGRVCDTVKKAGKAVKKVGSKSVKSLVADIEAVVHGAKDLTKDFADEIEGTVADAADAVGCVLNKSAGFAGHVFNEQHSVEEKPDNNVHISHPTKGTAQMIPMGLHIQPETSKDFSGQKVLMVEPGQLAEQASLKENDVIIAIGENDISKLTLNEVLHIFGTIASTFSMTVIRRRAFILVRHVITVEVHLHDNVVAIKVLNVKCSLLSYRTDGPQIHFHISHKSSPNAPRYFMKVTDDNMLTMDTQPNQRCNFKVNLYHPQCTPYTGPGSSPVNPITIQNVSCNRAVAVEQEESVHRITLGSTDDLTSDGIDVDLRFFLQHYPGGTQSVCSFELSDSSAQGKFLACENGCLKLKSWQYSTKADLDNIPVEFRFNINPPDVNG